MRRMGAIVKLALWQTYPTNGRIEQAFSSIRQQLIAAASAGAKLLLTPELILPGYNRPDLHASLAQPLEGEWITRLRQLCHDIGCGICIGWAERDGAYVYNAATTISDQGEVLAHYRKVQLFGQMEQASFTRGDRLCPVFDVSGRQAAMLVCYDIEFPAHAAALAKAGAELILVPTANPVGYEHVQKRLVPARAHENNAVVAYANLVGPEEELVFGGLSVISGPDGEPLAKAGAKGEALLIVDLAAADGVEDELRSVQTAEFHPV